MFNISENPSHFSGNRKKSTILHTSDRIRKSFTLLTENRRKSKIVKKTKPQIILLNVIVGLAEANKAEQQLPSATQNNNYFTKLQ